MVGNKVLYDYLLDKRYDYLKKVLEDNIREEALLDDKKAKSQYKIVKSMFESANLKSPDFKNRAFLTKDNTYFFVDGFRIFISNQSFGYEIATEETKELGFGIDASYAFYNRVMNDLFTKKYSVTLTREQKADLTVAIKRDKKTGPKAYKIRYTDEYGKKAYFGVNPGFLKDALDYTNGLDLVLCGNTDPIISVGENGSIAALLPVRIGGSSDD